MSLFVCSVGALFKGSQPCPCEAPGTGKPALSFGSLVTCPQGSHLACPRSRCPEDRSSLLDTRGAGRDHMSWPP